MKNTIKAISLGILCLASLSCGDFLDRPTEDNYVVENFYQNDAQVQAGVNYLYNSPWYDFQRGFIKVGEVMSGNMYWSNEPYMDFTTNGTNKDLINMSYSLWSVVAHSNTVITNILASEGPSQTVKNQAIGEALTMKALAYFFAVRSFGDIPIVHDNAALIDSGSYNEVFKVQKEDVYEYIIMTLEKAMELLEKNAHLGEYDRIDYYAAEGLLAKVYLTRAGVSGTLSQSDLDKAAQYAKDVIDNSGRSLTPKYSDVFRLAPATFNATGECLISWLWVAGTNRWTAQNTLQSDLAMGGFDEFGDCWGGWGGPSVDLCDAFGVSVLDNPATRVDTDARRKATLMMAGDVYEYFWTDKGGFDYLKFIYESNEYGKGGPSGELQCANGVNNVKNLYGNGYDHESALNIKAENMTNQLPTHILRLSDVYLIYAEAKLGAGRAASTDADVINAFAAVRGRSVSGYTAPASVTWDDIWKERRLELAGEGDRWYDFVRRSYYEADKCIDELKAQRRSYMQGMNDVYKNWVCNKDTGEYEGPGANAWDVKDAQYDPEAANKIPNVTVSSFVLPFPSQDVVYNMNMASNAEVVHVDVRTEYSYNF